LNAAQEHFTAPGQASLAKQAASSLASSAFAGLTSEERRAALSELSRDVARSAATGMKEAMTEAMGPNGRGPLADSMTRTAQRVAESTIFPECVGADRSACIQARMATLTQATAVGFARALRKELGLGALVIAFAAGVFCTLAVVSVWTWSTVRGRRGQVRSPERARPTPA
jgi:hypothetical protein